MKIYKRIIAALILFAVTISVCFNVYIVTRHPDLVRNLMLKVKTFKPGTLSTASVSPVVYYANFHDLHYVEPSASAAVKLPERLIIPKGVYIYGDMKYDLNDEGLYRFITPAKENEERIVYSKDISALMSSLCWILAHGKRDNGRGFDELAEEAKRSKLILVCGRANAWAHRLLEEKNIKSRIVFGLAVDRGNGYDAKHAFLEIYDDRMKKWILYDIDNNIVFKHNGDGMSLSDFMKYSQSGEYEIVYIAGDCNMDISGFKSGEGGFDFTFLFEALTLSQAHLRAWYSDLMKAPVIYNDGDGYNYFTCENEYRDKIPVDTRYRYLEKSEFLKKFYE